MSFVFLFLFCEQSLNFLEANDILPLLRSDHNSESLVTEEESAQKDSSNYTRKKQEGKMNRLWK